MTNTATTHKGEQQTYDTATHYRLFVRQYDEELKTVSWQFRGAWTDYDEADKARYQLWRDESKYRLILPGDNDPGQAKGTAQDRKDYVREVEDTSND
jgi:hypothetical protein